jgi:hypothetical protein
LQHRRLPAGVARGAVQLVQRIAVVGRRAAGGQLAIGLGHHQQVGELDDAALDALEIVAATGLHQQDLEVGHVSHRGFRLADADGLDHHDVEGKDPPPTA